MAATNRNNDPLKAFSRVLLAVAGITLILGLLLGGSLLCSPIAVQGLEVSTHSPAWVFVLLLLDQILVGAGFLVVLLTAVPAAFLAALALLFSIILVAPQNLGGIVAHAES